VDGEDTSRTHLPKPTDVRTRLTPEPGLDSWRKSPLSNRFVNSDRFKTSTVAAAGLAPPPPHTDNKDNEQ
jgi:hypothetical protein